MRVTKESIVVADIDSQLDQLGLIPNQRRSLYRKRRQWRDRGAGLDTFYALGQPVGEHERILYHDLNVLNTTLKEINSWLRNGASSPSKPRLTR